MVIELFVLRAPHWPVRESMIRKFKPQDAVSSGPFFATQHQGYAAKLETHKTQPQMDNGYSKCLKNTARQHQRVNKIKKTIKSVQ